MPFFHSWVVNLSQAQEAGNLSMKWSSPGGALCSEHPAEWWMPGWGRKGRGRLSGGPLPPWENSNVASYQQWVGNVVALDRAGRVLRRMGGRGWVKACVLDCGNSVTHHHHQTWQQESRRPSSSSDLGGQHWCVSGLTGPLGWPLVWWLCPEIKWTFLWREEKYALQHWEWK